MANGTAPLQDEDISSEDIETHRPGEKDERLEVDDRAYLLLEYVPLEWPAQSIAVADSRIYLGTNPEAGRGAAELIEIDIRDADFENLRFRDTEIPRYVNKIRHNRGLFALSDTHLTVFNDDLKIVGEVAGRFGYGLCVTDDLIFVGMQSGDLQIYDHALRLLHCYHVHKKSIEAIAFQDGVIYTGSVDHTLRLTDLSNQMIRSIAGSADINCLDVRGDRLLFGGDDAKIRIVDTRSFSEEVIGWHNTPVSAVKWKDSEVFASGSDEQVCIWDTSLVEEWEYHKYLLFVHQGQQLYKDVCFDGDRVVTTSLDGLCIFTPVSFSTDSM